MIIDFGSAGKGKKLHQAGWKLSFGSLDKIYLSALRCENKNFMTIELLFTVLGYRSSIKIISHVFRLGIFSVKELNNLYQ